MGKFLSPLWWLMLVVVILFPTTSADSQSSLCGHRDMMIPMMQQHFMEIRRWSGVSGEGLVLVELWANHKTGSWTITTTRTDMTFCAVLVGSDSGFNPSGLYQ